MCKISVSICPIMTASDNIVFCRADCAMFCTSSYYPNEEHDGY